jgi:hypothetical protein
MKIFNVYILLFLFLIRCSSPSDSTIKVNAEKPEIAEEKETKLEVKKLRNTINPKDYLKSNLSLLIDDMNLMKEADYIYSLVIKKESTKFIELNYADSMVNVDTSYMRSTYYYDSTGLIFIESKTNDSPHLDVNYYLNKVGKDVFCYPYDTNKKSLGMIYIPENGMPIFIRMEKTNNVETISKIMLLDNRFYPVAELHRIDENSKKKKSYLFERRIFNYIEKYPHFLKNTILYDKITISSTSTLEDIITLLSIELDKTKLVGEKYYPGVDPVYYLVPMWQRLPYLEYNEQEVISLGGVITDGR